MTSEAGQAGVVAPLGAEQSESCAEIVGSEVRESCGPACLGEDVIRVEFDPQRFAVGNGTSSTLAIDQDFQRFPLALGLREGFVET